MLARSGMIRGSLRRQRLGNPYRTSIINPETLIDRSSGAPNGWARLALRGQERGWGRWHPPMGSLFGSWFSRISARRAGVHEEGEILAALEERFTTRSLSYGPYLRQGLDAEVEPLERKLIAEGGI